MSLKIGSSPGISSSEWTATTIVQFVYTIIYIQKKAAIESERGKHYIIIEYYTRAQKILLCLFYSTHLSCLFFPVCVVFFLSGISKLAALFFPLKYYGSRRRCSDRHTPYYQYIEQYVVQQHYDHFVYQYYFYICMQLLLPHSTFSTSTSYLLTILLLILSTYLLCTYTSTL